MGFQLQNLEELRREHDRLLAENERMIGDALEVAGRHAVEHVQHFPEFNPQTGALQKATKARVVRMRNGRVLKITNTKPYAAAIDTGARAHVIVPRKAKMLRFVGKDGRTVFARRVNHPGNKPYRFMFFATDAADRVFRADIEHRMAALAARF
jgi:hypothetical protein